MRRRRRSWREPEEELRHWFGFISLAILGLVPTVAGAFIVIDQKAEVRGSRWSIPSELVGTEAVGYGIFTMIFGICFLLVALVYWNNNLR